MESKQSKKKTAKKAIAKKKAATKKAPAKKAPAKKAPAKKAATKKAPAKKPVRRKKKKNTKVNEHYVNGKEFYEQIKEYYASGADTPPDVLAEAIQKISTGLSFAPNFINYSYKDEMVGDAILKMFLALKNKKFNCETHNNPFSYFTTIAFHAFINRIKKEKKHRDTITRYQETVYGDMMQENDAGAQVYTDPSNPSEDE